MKKKILLMLVAVLAIAGALVGIFRKDIRVLVAPKTVLRQAVSAAWDGLETRFSGSPLPVLASAVPENGCNTVSLEMDRGNLHYDMTLQTSLAPKQVLARGRITGGKLAAELFAYADSRFAGVRFGDSEDSTWFGITYDTFSRDIRSSPMTAMLLGEESIARLEQQVADLAGAMAGEISLPRITQSQLRLAMTGLLALHAQVDRTQDAGVRIRFSLPGSLIREGCDLAGVTLPVTLDESSQVVADFYLKEEVLTGVSLELTGPEPLRALLSLGENAGTDRLSLLLEGESRYVLTVDTLSSDRLYTEQLTLSRDGTRIKTLHYSWDRETGEGQLSDGDISVLLSLRASEGGVTLTTGDLDALLAIFGRGEDAADTPATLTVSGGTAFNPPEYRNLDQWSMEDMLELLSGLGGLLGLEF